MIVQAVDPPAPYPATQTVQQILACRDAGMVVETYIYLWNNWPEGVDRALALLPPGVVTRVWLDVEDVSAPLTAPGLAAALAKVEAAGYSVGIYTARWYWPRELDLSRRPLWVAQYDGAANLDFEKFGGWDRCEMKQYTLDKARAFGLNHFGESAAAGLADRLRALADEVEALG